MSPIELRRLYEGGMNTNQIAAIVGCSGANIAYRLHRLGVKMRGHKEARALVPSKVWNDEKRAVVIEMWKQGYSLAVIGERVGASTKSVEHERVRLGLEPRRKPNKSTPVASVARLPKPDLRPLPVLARVASCRWPEGDPKHADFHFCEAPAKENSSYCPTHHARAYQPRMAAE